MKSEENRINKVSNSLKDGEILSIVMKSIYSVLMFIVVFLLMIGIKNIIPVKSVMT